MRHIPIAILGAGFGGLAAARACQAAGVEYVVFEQRDYVGGIAASFTVGPYTFDYGIHGLYTSNLEDLDELVNSLGLDDTEILVSIADYWDGCWTRHPIYSNLAQIPHNKSSPLMRDFLERVSASTETNSFHDWICASFGEELASQILLPYIAKFWTVGASELTLDWSGARFRVPSVSEFLEGATSLDSANRHYVQRVRYPRKGGFGRYSSVYADQIVIEFCKEVVRIDVNDRRLLFRDHSSATYDVLISTLPLPVLLNVISPAPADVTRAAGMLRATSLALVSLCCASASTLPHHWVYVYDPEICFARLSQPHLWAASNAPERASSLQAEVYFQGAAPAPAQLYNKVCAGLTRMGLSDQIDHVIATDIRYVPFANVIHDHDRSAALEIITHFLRSTEILVCGRYGQWNYALVHEVVRDGSDAAQEATNHPKIQNGFGRTGAS